MSRCVYTPEMKQFVAEYAPGHWIFEIIEAFRERFGMELTRCQMRSLMKNSGIKSNAKKLRGMSGIMYNRLTTPELDAMVKENFHDKGKGGYKDVQLFLKSQGVELTLVQVKSYLSRCKIRLGTYGYFKKGSVPANKGKKMPLEIYEKVAKTMFRPGNQPKNILPVGTERVSKDGYIEIKVANPNKWMSKARYIWEQHTGEPLKRNETVIFLDGDKLNLKIDNLAKVTRSQLARLNQNHLIYNNQELTRVGITLAKLLDMKGRLKK